MFYRYRHDTTCKGPQVEKLDDVWGRNHRVLARSAGTSRSTAACPGRAEVEKATGLSEQDVQRAGQNLARAGLVDTRSSHGMPVLWFTNIGPDALTATGLWPTPETAADRMIAALEQLAESGSTEDERTRRRKILDGFNGAGRQVAIGVATAAHHRTAAAVGPRHWTSSASPSASKPWTNAPLPFDELGRDFHVHTDVMDLLRLIRPDVSSFLERSQGNDGATSARGASTLTASS